MMKNTAFSPRIGWRWLAAPALAASLLAGAVVLSGCSADGPMTQLTSMNPLVRRQWRDDERQTTTFYQRMEELKSLESKAGRLVESDRAAAAEKLTDLVRREPNPLLRAQAVRVLAQIDHPAAEIGLNMAESDANAEVRQEICRIRGAQRSRQGLQALARILSSDADPDVRISAARELANYRDSEAYRALGSALTDNDPALQHRAMASLRRATGRDLGNDVAAWQKFLQTGEVDSSQSSWASRLNILR